MTNDAKLGLVMGVTLVLVIGLVFFRQDALAAKVPGDQPRSTATLHQVIKPQYERSDSWKLR